MGGGGGGSSNTAVQIDPGSVNEFAQSESGRNYSQQDIGYLNSGNVYYNNDPNLGGYKVYDNGQTVNLNDIYNDYQSWLSGQAEKDSNQTQYLQLANLQGGRDQTILTGPAAQGTTLTR